ncbi:ABC transporter permease [Mucilaginibacter mallensis]|nr:ABC transporter permease [Mucilaginibacter mallensis]
MEEHIWFLVELFISGKATEAEASELAYLLGSHADLLNMVKEFLGEYNDPDPQVTFSQKQALLNRAENIHNEFAYLRQPTQTRQRVQVVNDNVLSKIPKISFADRVRHESLIFSQLLKITIRQLRRNRAISFINISGLAIGMATAILIFLWVANELSYDQFHTNKDRIYEVYSQTKVNGQLRVDGGLPSILAPVLKANYPQVEEVNRLSGVGSFVLKHGDKRFEGRGVLTDPNFFKFFSYQFSEGNAATALTGLHTIVLTQQMAHKLFGNEDPMGKIVKIDSIANFTVTGVLKPLPANTVLNFVEYFVPLSYMKEVHWARDDWGSNTVQTYVMLKHGISRQTVEGLFWNVFSNQHVNPGTNAVVQPMADWWLYSDYENGKFLPGRLVMVKWFALIAALVMLIACINYMNLGTARSAKRAKEVGIRKVAGAGRGILIKQFLGESVLTAITAAVLCIGLVQLCLPAFDNLVGDNLTVPYGNPLFWLAVISFAFITGIFAGIYPAFYLSAYRPVKVLKGILTSAGSLLAPRKVMVVMQFTLAITFIICTLVIYRQIDFGLHRSKGYDSTNLVNIYIKGDIEKNYPVIKQELLESGAITGITRTNSSVDDIWTANDDYSWQGKNPSVSITFEENFTDQDFTQTSGITLLEGRDIDVYRYPSDTAAVLLTETAVKKIGFKNPVGQLIKKGNINLHVVGVIRDYIAGWAYELPKPIIIRGTTKQYGAMNFRLSNTQPVSTSLSKIGAIVRKYNPDYPFAYRFVDNIYKDRIKGDENFGTMAAAFAGLAIFISCMGLFALATFMAENRIKEIGIRKVLGASVAAITTLLSKDFLALVAIAFVIASPIAWWLMNKWLSNYPLHISIGYWVFLLTGAASILIALVTVGFQALKTAILNPIKNLRTE